MPIENRNALVACPMKKEAEALRRRLGERVLASGLGIKRTVPALLKQFRTERPSMLVFTGSVGQLDLTLTMGDVVVPAAWRIENGPRFDCDPTLLSMLRAKGWRIADLGLTVERPVMRAQHRSSQHAATGACVYDTVTAAVLRVCQTSQVPCLTPKIVASTVNSGLTAFWNRLDSNIAPLAEAIERLLKDVNSE